jgi:hypothetical protein
MRPGRRPSDGEDEVERAPTDFGGAVDRYEPETPIAMLVFQLGLGLLSAILTVCNIATFGLRNATFNEVNAALYAALLTSPAYIVVLFSLRKFLVLFGPWDMRKLIASLILLVLASTINGLALNQWLDWSAPEEKTYVLTSKSITNTRGGCSHSAVFASGAPDLIPFHLFPSAREGVCLGWSEYDRVIPGGTRITLRVHNGAFGLPWFERAYTLSDLAAHRSAAK